MHTAAELSQTEQSKLSLKECMGGRFPGDKDGVVMRRGDGGGMRIVRGERGSLGETVVNCFPEGLFYREEFGLVNDSLNVKICIIEDDVVSFFPNVSNHENEFCDLGLMLPKSG